MFETSLLGLDEGAGRRRKQWIALGCMGFQVSLITALVVVPLLHPETLPPMRTARLKWVSLVKPKVTPPKPVVVHVTNAAATRASASAAPAVAHAMNRPMIAPTVATTTDIPPLLPYGNMVPSGPALVGAMVTSNAAGPAVTVKPAGVGDGKPLAISTGVSAGLLLAPIRPNYPQMAVMTRTQGVVVVTAIIDKNGRIVGVKVVSGPAMLQQAAADAVREARYRPYLLNGQPTEVMTTFSVNFTMSGG